MTADAVCAYELATAAHVAPTAKTITGKVVHVADGDTITVLVAGNRQVKVPLHGMDDLDRAALTIDVCRL